MGNWDDVGAGREQAFAQIAQNVDAIFQNAAAAGLGVFQAARETGRALVLGSNADQNDVVPDVILASAVFELPHTFHTVAPTVREGRLKPGVILLGANADVVRLALNSALARRVPAEIRARADSGWAQLLRGQLEIPTGASATQPPR